MKRYYIDDRVKFCYPSEIPQITKEYGVLEPYMGKLFSEEEMDKIICEMIMRHPYVKGAMDLKVNVMWQEVSTKPPKDSLRESFGNGARGYYHMLEFRNDDYRSQKKQGLAICYEKEPLREITEEEEREL